MKYGITPRKTFTLKDVINNILYNFRDSFILGYFDGDGSVSVRDKLTLKKSNNRYYPSHTINVNIRGTYKFLYGICEHLNVTTNHIKKYDSTYSLLINSKKDIVRFLSVMII